MNKKWSNAVIMLWYPLLAHRNNDIEQMLETIKQSVLNINHNTQISNLQLVVNTKDSHKEVSLKDNAFVNDAPRLYGSGMLVINSPYMLEENALKSIEFLTNVFWKKTQ